MQEAVAARTPAHLWIVGLVATLWNGFGCYNYLMTRMRNTAHIEKMTGGDANAMLAWVDQFPVWAQFGWGLGVWAGLLGSVLLLARSRHAAWVLALSLLGVMLVMGYQLGLAPPQPGATGFDPIPLVVIVIAVGLLLYARTMQRRGVLR